jgi:hypothetical protein
MEGIKRQIKYQITDTKKAFIIFWAIVIAVDILFYILNTRIASNAFFGTGSITSVIDASGQSVSTRYLNVTGQNIIAIWIFIIVYSMIMYYESFPTALGFSATRKDFYIGAVAHNLVLCFAMAVIEGILLKMDRIFIKAIGELPLDTFLMLDLEHNNTLYVISVLFIMFILCAAAFNLLGTILYKFGYKVWFIFLAVAMVLGNTVADYAKYISIYFFEFNNIVTFSAKFITMSAILYGLGWLFIKRQNIRSSK